jgi:hypothetical protein
LRAAVIGAMPMGEKKVYEIRVEGHLDDGFSFPFLTLNPLIFL